MTQQAVAIVFPYGEIHGGFLANYFPHGDGVVVGATWGGDVGTPLYRFARDRVRFAVRFQTDGGIVRRDRMGDERFDFQIATFLLGPQLWLRLSPTTFLTVRTAAGGTAFMYDLPGAKLDLTPTVDATLGFAFDL